MFRVENNVPDVYVSESRDFQLFSRLYDLVFQSSRFSIDSMTQISDTMRCNDALLPLIATKIGFFTDLYLTSKSDRIILSAFSYVVKHKGSLKGVFLVANMFERIMNTSVVVQTEKDDRNHITIVFEDYTPDVNLLYSLLEYIRPTGLLIDYQVRTNMKVKSNSNFSDSVKFTVFDEPSNIISNEKPEYISNVGFAQIYDNNSEEESSNG